MFDGRRLSTVTAGDGNRLSDLRVSPGGGFIAVRSGDDFLLLDERGNVLPAPSVAGYRAIAWSPDEQWVAVAAERGVFVFRPGVGDRRSSSSPSTPGTWTGAARPGRRL